MDDKEFIQEFKLLHEKELLDSRRHSIEVIQKLTYFVISSELVACGYILITADKLVAIESLHFLFLALAFAAFFGLLWRFFYNQTYFNNVHDESGELVNNYFRKTSVLLRTVTYYTYVVLSILSMCWLTLIGFNYLKSLTVPLA